jgi:hypothetical protein
MTLIHAEARIPHCTCSLWRLFENDDMLKDDMVMMLMTLMTPRQELMLLNSEVCSEVPLTRPDSSPPICSAYLMVVTCR